MSITPELGLWRWINNETAESQNLIDQRFPDATLNIHNLIIQCELAIPNPPNNERTEAKNKVTWICNAIYALTNEDTKRIKQHLFASLAEHKYSQVQNRDSLNQLFGPIFSH